MVTYSYHNVDKVEVVDSKGHDLYQYRAYIGPQDVATNTYSSYWYIDNGRVVSTTGTGGVISSTLLCVEIFGYTPETRTSTFSRLSDLPYINGCSTKQLIDPVRPGDPTWQLLYMPKHTVEQAHHIHSTARIVYVHQGSGHSIIGTGDHYERIPLVEGTVIILDKMIPHHFETGASQLVVLPIHVFSSTPQEYSHPMLTGTHRT